MTSTSDKISCETEPQEAERADQTAVSAKAATRNTAEATTHNREGEQRRTESSSPDSSGSSAAHNTHRIVRDLDMAIPPDSANEFSSLRQISGAKKGAKFVAVQQKPDRRRCRRVLRRTPDKKWVEIRRMSREETDGSGQLIEKRRCSGFVLKQFPCAPDQHKFIRGLLRPVLRRVKHPPDTYRAFCHVLASQLFRLVESEEDDYLWIPFSSTLQQLEVAGFDWRALVDAGVLEVTDYSWKGGRSREYCVPSAIFDEFLSRDLPIGSSPIRAAVVNLFTGERTRARQCSRLSDERRTRRPPTIEGALKEMGRHRRPFNWTQCYRHIVALSNEYEESRRRLGDLHAVTLKTKRRLQADDCCLRAVQRNGTLEMVATYNDPVTGQLNEIWSYTPAYGVSKTGRLTERGGGLQNASREMKAASMIGLNGRIINYDLESSQVIGAIQQAEMVGTKTEGLERYANTENAKSVYAELARMPVKTFKHALIMMLMGATVPASIKPRTEKEPSRKVTRGNGRKQRRRRREDSMTTCLLKAADGNLERANEMLAGFRRVTEDLRSDLAEWHRALLPWVERAKRRDRGGSGREYIYNANGSRLGVNDDEWWSMPPHERVSMVAAFLLQGAEAAFIDQLTAIGPKYGYKVLANEHDGVICDGEIPQAAMEEASKLSGLARFRLVKKDFI